MQEEIKVLNLNKKRIVVSFILMVVFFGVFLAGMIFSNYVDSTYNMLKTDKSSTSFANVVFRLPFLLTILSSYIFFFLYIQCYYDTLIKLKINKPNKYWLFFYVSFFIPLIKQFFPFIGILYLLWNLINIKNKIIVGIVYFFPLFFINFLVITGIYSKIRAVVSNKTISYAIENGVHSLLIWMCILIILHIMNTSIIKKIEENNKYLNLTTAST